jgi:hypothetical protein
VPVRIVAAVWCGAVVLAVFGVIDAGGVVLWMHLGAAAWAFVAARAEAAPRTTSWWGRQVRGRTRTPAARSGPDDVQARVDALLDKISRDGIGALTDDERAFLQRASKRV